MGRTAKAVVPAEAKLPGPVEYPLPTLPRTFSASLAAPQQSGADILADAVERVYASGEQNTNAGRPEAARKDFELGVHWLLASGYDLRANPRLDQLYGHILTAMRLNEAASQAEAAAELQGKPAAIDEIPESVTPADPQLKARAERQIKALPHDLPLTTTDPVLAYVSFFETARGRAIVARGLRRAGRYRQMISRVLAEEGMPQDLIYVAQAESAFEPLAVSRARAVGIWQFIAGSGAKYGLTHTWWVDERRDPEKSTRAAARYFRDLYAMFGDWYLALAAYNTGEGNVAKAVERTGYADFWELYRRNALLKQTRNYVPIILALALIAKDPASHGIVVEAEPPEECDVVKPGHAVDLRLAADAVDDDLETLKTLNPQLLRTVTPPDPDFELRLPRGTGEDLVAGLAQIPTDKWVMWRQHRVAEGDTLGAIGRRYGVTPSAILQANNLDSGAPLSIGQTLTIPANHAAQTGLGQLVRYRVRRGDTLTLVARQFDVTPADIERWNGPRSATLSPGMTLKIYPGGRPNPTPAPAGQKALKTHKLAAEKTNVTTGDQGTVTHSVRPGETLWSIARAYRTTVEALRAANPFLAGHALHVGDQLRILTPR